MSNDSSNPAVPQASGITWKPIMGVLYTILVFFAAQIVAGIILSIYPLTRHWTNAQTTAWLDSSVYAQFAFILLAEGLTLSALYWWLKHFKTSLVSIGLTRLRWKHVVAGLLAVPIYYLLYLLSVGVVSHFVPSLDLNQEQEIGFNNVAGALPLVLTFISLVILPPLTEEIMVRGFLYGSLRKSLTFVWAAVLTSAIFAAAHLPEGGSSGLLWIGALDTFVLSLVLCYLREKTGSLWPGITLHALKNGVAFTALFLIGVH
jgi:membrane protease YdiL (CAAX protease family)